MISVDEKTGITARSRKHPDLPGHPGRRTRREFEYVRHGTVSIVAARRLLRRGEFNSRNQLADRIDDFVLAYDEHDAKPHRWTYDGTPLKAA